MEFSIATKTVTAEYRNDWPEMGQYRVFVGGLCCVVAMLGRATNSRGRGSLSASPRENAGASLRFSAWRRAMERSQVVGPGKDASISVQSWVASKRGHSSFAVCNVTKFRGGWG